MELPLVEEIREARRLSEEARDASIQLQRINAVLTSLAVLEGQTIPAGSEVALPGDDAVDLVADRWSQLADLRSADPRPGCPLTECIAARRQQMETAWRELKPLADTLEYHAHQLSHLQEEQRELLDDPRYSEATAELHAIGVEREQHARAIGPIRQRLGMVSPGSTVATTLASRIDVEIEQLRMVVDPTGMATWRAASVAGSLLDAVTQALHGLGFELPVPGAPEVSETPEGADRDELLAELDRVSAGLHGLIDSLDAQRVQLEAEDNRISIHLDALTKQLLDRMG